ncbi:hypothetical protein C8R48DRAFT_672813 [Suillus tomentosus]|nr:hypothetical protein C8R48DRAFT_672813 [Suillus tomentosus]
MACTKNTAKKCTSGSAPHVLLKIAAAGLAQHKKALANTKDTMGGGDVENRTVYHNEMDSAEHFEENTLFLYTLCPRVISRLFLKLLPTIEVKVLQEDISYTLYFGFYNANGLPLLTVATSLFQFTHNFLKPYFTSGSIDYVKIYYDIGTDTKLTPYWTKFCQLIKGLKNLFIWEYVVIGVSTHTDEEYEDFFTGYEDYDPKGYISTPVNDLLRMCSRVGSEGLGFSLYAAPLT